MKDSVVLMSLQARNFDYSNVEEMLRYEAMERLPRVLDKAPKRISLKSSKDIPVFGCKAEFKVSYDTIMSETVGECFWLDLNAVRKVCDKEIYVVLQTLMRHGICFNEEIADSCYDLFRRICMTQADTLTKERVYNELRPLKPDTYWGKQLLEAVKECLFGESPVALYWNSIAQFSGMYRECFERGRDVLLEQCQTEKDVDKFVSTHYKEARADKEFMKDTYLDGVSKALTAMLYYLGKKDPEVLQLEEM